MQYPAVRRSPLLRILALGSFALLAIGAFAGTRGQEPAPPAQAQLILRARIPASGAPPQLRLEDQPFRASSDLPCFYERRGFEPAWSDGAALRTQADGLLAALAAAGDEGLRPEDYREAALRRLAGEARSHPEPGALAEMDLLLTDAFLTYASHLRDGKINPQKIYSDCGLKPEEGDLAAVLQTALDAGRVREALTDLAPPQPGYRRLRDALRRYRQVAARGTPEPVSKGPTLRLGDRGERVAALRSHLALDAEADAASPVPAPEEGPDLFDAGLDAAVRAFQERHGLETDGLAGPATLGELATSPDAHVRQIVVNLERWRWLPRDPGERHVLVNVAGFRLDAVEDEQTALRMRIIVGKPYTRTPTFSSAINQVVFNPSWYVPRSIAVNEIGPRVKQDPGYLVRQNFEVLPGGGYRQRPGPQNALGKIKFLFPNRFGVYLHDTPTRSLFSRAVRTFSHGCMRIEKPMDFAVWLFRGDPKWTPEAIQAAVDAGRERKVALPRSVPVHVTYASAWVNEDGVLQVGRDVYDRDAGLWERLQE